MEGSSARRLRGDAVRVTPKAPDTSRWIHAGPTGPRSTALAPKDKPLRTLVDLFILLSADPLRLSILTSPPTVADHFCSPSHSLTEQSLVTFFPPLTLFSETLVGFTLQITRNFNSLTY